MLVKCDVLDCCYNNNFKCDCDKIEITFKHDEESGKVYIVCDTKED